jgi:hypothetical protein
VPIYLLHPKVCGPVFRRGRRWIELASFQFGQPRKGRPVSSITVKQHSRPDTLIIRGGHVVCTKEYDDASHALLLAATGGPGFVDVLVELVKDGPHDAERAPYLSCKLTSTLFGNFSRSPDLESFSIDFVDVIMTEGPLETPTGLGQCHDVALLMHEKARAEVRTESRKQEPVKRHATERR